MKAATRSMASRRWREAALQLDQAAGCFARVDDSEARFEALHGRAKALVYCDLGDETLACARAANAAATTDAQRLRGAFALLEVLAQRGDFGEVLAIGEPAIALARARGDREAELRLAIRISGSLSNIQRSKEALALLEPLKAWVDASAAAGDRAEYYMALAFALDFDGRLVDATRSLEACCQVARAAGLDVALAEALSNLATANAKLGRIRRAVELSEQAVAMMRGDEGMSGRPLQSQSLLAHRLRDLGHYAEALPLLEEALAHFRAAGSRHWISAVAHRLALTWLQLGQFARAQRILADDPGDPAPRLQAMWEVSLAELARLAVPQRLATRRCTSATRWIVCVNGRRTARIASPRSSRPRSWPRTRASLSRRTWRRWASARERFGLALGAHVRAAACALAQGASRRALPHVEAALRLAPDYETDSMYRGELWLVAARVYEAVKERTLAARMAAQGCAWVQDIADRHVPAAFRDSFLNRNATNRELFALARRLG